jgi:hypothetical protein
MAKPTAAPTGVSTGRRARTAMPAPRATTVAPAMSALGSERLDARARTKRSPVPNHHAKRPPRTGNRTSMLRDPRRRGESGRCVEGVRALLVEGDILHAAELGHRLPENPGHDLLKGAGRRSAALASAGHGDFRNGVGTQAHQSHGPPWLSTSGFTRL